MVLDIMSILKFHNSVDFKTKNWFIQKLYFLSNLLFFKYQYLK